MMLRHWPHLLVRWHLYTPELIDDSRFLKMSFVYFLTVKARARGGTSIYFVMPVCGMTGLVCEEKFPK